MDNVGQELEPVLDNIEAVVIDQVNAGVEIEPVPQYQQLPPMIDISNNEPEAVADNNPDPGGEQEPNIQPTDVETDDDIVVVTKAKRKRIDDDPEEKEVQNNDNSDVGEACPICLDPCSNVGEHRLCALRCGHLFGQSCVRKWLQESCTSSNRRCPHCNLKAALKDIRILYARKLSVIDTTEIENLKIKLEEVTSEKKRLEIEIGNFKLRQRLYEQQVLQMTARMTELEKQHSEISVKLNQKDKTNQATSFYLDKTLEICRNGGCRVLDYNPWNNCLVVSQKSLGGLFNGYGIRKIDVATFTPKQFMLVHTHAIRDVAFHPSERSMLLSVSFDKTVKIIDIQNNTIVHGYPTETQLWSGCWSGQNPNTFIVGAANGSIIEFDTRNTAGAVSTYPNPDDRSPVVSMATVPPDSAAGISKGGFIAAQLNSCNAYETNNITTFVPRRMYLEGPFVSVRYDRKNHLALVSSRPSSRQTEGRHTVFTMHKECDDEVSCNVIHSFNAGKSQQLLSRSCLINLGDDTVVASFKESSNCIPLWSIASGNSIFQIVITDPVIDMCSFQRDEKVCLATVSSKKLRIYVQRL